MSSLKNILITGGAGYVGSQLAPALLEKGYSVTVLDLYLYGDDVLDTVKNHPRLKQIKGDIRDRLTVRRALHECDAVIHLACISNDPGFDLNPEVGRSINYDAFFILLEEAQSAGVLRFVYASSSSVYGIRKEKNVTEDLELCPLTDYSKYKVLCEKAFFEKDYPFTRLIIRPATVCGYSPRMRLDLTVNILTNHAINNGVIKVFGGEQLRPNIHIDDMVALYEKTLEWSDELIDKKIYNAGYENFKIKEIAEMVRKVIGSTVSIVVEPTNDNRSYHISSERIKQELGFEPVLSIEDAVRDLKEAFDHGKIPHSMENNLYYNMKRLKEVCLT